MKETHLVGLIAKRATNQSVHPALVLFFVQCTLISFHSLIRYVDLVHLQGVIR